MIAGAILVVEDGEVVTMITHLVKTEVLPFAGWDMNLLQKARLEKL